MTEYVREQNRVTKVQRKGARYVGDVFPRVEVLRNGKWAVALSSEEAYDFGCVATTESAAGWIDWEQVRKLDSGAWKHLHPTEMVPVEDRSGWNWDNAMHGTYSEVDITYDWWREQA